MFLGGRFVTARTVGLAWMWGSKYRPTVVLVKFVM